MRKYLFVILLLIVFIKPAAAMEKAEKRLAADRDAAEKRLSSDRREAIERLERERGEFKRDRKWMFAIFLAVLALIASALGLLPDVFHNLLP